MGQISAYFNSAMTATAVAAAAGIYGSVASIHAENSNAADVFLQLFDAAGTSAVTLGTTVPTYVIPLVKSAPTNLANLALKFRAGLVAAITTTATGSTAAGSTCPVTINFQ